ncbi:hypothetical protein GCM10027048_06280 [Hymenobacter coalescens]
MDDFVYLIRVSNPKQLPGQLRIVRANDGAIMYWGSITRNASFGQKFNVANLPDGQYTFVVKIGSDVRRYALDLNTVMKRSARVGTVGLTAMTTP